MRIGIIGSGSVGGALTRRLRVLGHDVTVANSRGPQSLTELATETGATAGTVEEAAGADVVVLAVPLRVVPRLPAHALRDKVVVDANNYYHQRDGHVDELDDKRVTSSRWVAEQLPGARVVKAFNNTMAQNVLERSRPAGTVGRIALPVAGDDPQAKQTVSALVDEIGFDPVDAGTLDESWRQQPGSPVYGADLDAEGVRRALSEAKP